MPPVEHRRRGIALRVGGVSCFAAMMAALKYGTVHGVDPVEVLFYRNLFSLPTIVAWVVLGGGWATVRTQRPAAHATRSALGLSVMFCTFLSLSMLPLAEATLISFSAPFFATALSALLLREKVLWHRWTGIAVGITGVIDVVRPGEAALPLAGIVVGLTAALGAGLVTITLRQIGRTETATATVFWFNLACLLATAIPMPFVFRIHSPDVWVALVIGGLMGGIAQIMTTAAVRYAPVSALAPFDYLQIVWAMLWSLFLFGTYPAASAIAGAVLIGAGGVYVLWRERHMHKAVVASASEV